MDEEILKIVTELKAKIALKHKLKELKVFGSSARGDRRDDSDIDMYILIPEINRKLEEELFDIAMEKSKESIEAAEIMLKNKMLTFSMNRIYYSMFYAVQALLAARQVSFSKHG